MDCAGTADLKLQFSDKFDVSVNALVVPQLSASIILGMDVIDDLAIRKNSNFVHLNGHRLKLSSPFEDQRVMYVKNATVLEPMADSIIQINNVFTKTQNSENLLLAIDPLLRQRGTDNFTVTPGLYKNEKNINVLVTNRTSKRIYLGRRRPLCLAQQIEMAKCNGVTVLPNKLEETEMIEKFQKDRAKKAEEKTFEPKIGSFGDLDENQKKNLDNLVQTNRLAFSMDPSDLGRLGHFAFTLPMHDETETAHQPPRPIPIHIKPKVDAEINSWKELGIIGPTQSGFNIPLIILKKPDGTIRVSLDARELNTKLQKDRFPLPHMTTIFTKIGEKLTSGEECWISVFDFHRGYWQIRVDPKDSHKLAFSYDGEHLCANRMLYGTTTSPSCFSRIMMELFGKNDSFLLYLDDLIIIDSSFDDHLQSLKFLFTTCQKYGLLLSAKKAHLCKRTINFLGHKISKDGIAPMDKHKKAVTDFPRPSDKQSLKRFLGMVNYNLKFVKDASITLKPLHSICSTRQDFVWGTDQENAFTKIKDDLVNAPGICHRNPKLEIVLVSDASKDGVGATLYQINGSKWEVIGYFSKALSRADQRRPMRVKELLGLVYAIRSFEYYLINATFTAISDHKSLLYLYREHLRTKLDAKLTNIFFYLQNFDFKIKHAAGSSDVMASADCLSRIPGSTLEEMEEIINQNDIPDRIFTTLHFPEKSGKEKEPMRYYLRSLAKQSRNEIEETNEVTNEPEIDDTSEKAILKFEDYNLTHSEMLKQQENSSFVQNMKKKLEIRTKSSTKKYELNDGLLYNISKSSKRIILPENIGIEFLKYLHVSYGHCGSKQLSKLASTHVFIPNLHENIAIICRQCVDCLRNKSQKGLRPSLIPKRSFESVPWTKTGVDLFDLGKTDCNNKRYLVTMVDHLTGFVEGVPISNKTDKLVGKAMLEMILRHGITGRIVTDNGREFGENFKEVLDKFRIIHVRTAAYQSRSNGKCERIHREIVAKLKLLDTNRQKWSQNWPFVQFMPNNLPKTSLDGLSAAEALYGRALFVPFEIISPVENATEPYIKALNSYLNEIHPALMNFQYNKYAKLLEKDTGNAPTLKIGSTALVWKPDIAEGKLSKSWAGPYTVIKRLSKDTYVLKDKKTQRTYRRSIRHLRPIRSTESDLEAEDENQINESEQKLIGEDEFQRQNDFSQLPQFNCVE